MTHKEVYEKASELFDLEDVIAWFQNGHHSIRLQSYDRSEVVFTYHSDENWKLETKESFVNSIIDKRRKHNANQI